VIVAPVGGIEAASIEKCLQKENASNDFFEQRMKSEEEFDDASNFEWRIDGGDSCPNHGRVTTTVFKAANRFRHRGAGA